MPPGGVVRPCLACGDPIDDTMKFCPSCGAPVGAEPPPPISPTPRELRARRRRRRRVVGVVVLVLIALAIGGAVYVAASGSDSSPKRVASAPVTSSTTTVPKVHVAGPYLVTTSVNIREAPSTANKIVGTVSIGKKVLVLCVADGETVTAPTGTSNKWLRITGLGATGYVSAPYVETGADLTNPTVIPVCTGA